MTESQTRAQWSSLSDAWPTPRWLFGLLDREFRFTLDPCATPENATCARFFTQGIDGLEQDWSGDVVYMNPPYGKEIGRWMRKAYRESRKGATVVCLVPSRTDSRWWHAYAMRGEIRFIKGRLCFGDSAGRAPFPSAIIVFRPGGRANVRRPVSAIDAKSIGVETLFGGVDE